MSDNNFNEENLITETGVPSEPPKKSAAREVGEWVLSIVIALAIALLLRNYVISFVRVDGTSMVPTLLNNERLLVVRLGYKPQSGDIIILDPGPDPYTGKKRGPYVKRVIGMSGQTVKIDNQTGDVYVDGNKLNEQAYINNKTESNTNELVAEYNVPENCVFVMGDNRGFSHDSRSADVSFIPYERVMGKAVFRVWPPNKFGKVK